MSFKLFNIDHLIIESDSELRVILSNMYKKEYLFTSYFVPHKEKYKDFGGNG